MLKITIPAVYYVSVKSTEPDDFIDPLAIRPHFENAEIHWEDTSSHGRILKMTEVTFISGKEEKKEAAEEFEKKFPEKIVVQSNSKIYTLEYLTKQLYEAHVREYAAREPNFSNTEEVQQFYLTQYFGP